MKFDIGIQLRRLRQAKRLTLETVAGEIGFSKALLSQIENNNVSPPIATLSKLAKFYGVRMSSFFAEAAEHRRYEVIRRGERKSVSRVISTDGTDAGYFYESFAFKMQEKKMNCFLVGLFGGVDHETTYSHEGEAFIYALRGSCEIVLQNTRIVLEEGDGIYLDTSIEHGYRAVEGHDSRVLIVEI